MKAAPPPPTVEERYQTQADGADKCVGEVLRVLFDAEPELVEATLVGGITAVVRAYIDRTGSLVQVATSQEVLQALFPVVRRSADQIFEARRPPKIEAADEAPAEG